MMLILPLPQELHSLVAHSVPVGLRVGSLFTFAPFFGSATLPIRFRAVLTALVTALLYPISQVPEPPAAPAEWTRVALGEITLGLAMGLTVQFVLEAAQLAGQIIGFQFAFSLVNVIDPQTNVDTPVLAIFHQLIAILFLLAFNVHHWLLRGIAKSFAYAPVGSLSISAEGLQVLLQSAAGMFLAGIQMALPLLLVTLLIDVTVGFLSKASPQLPALTLSIPLKSAIGYATLGVVAVAWPELFERQFIAALGWSERVLHLAKSAG